MEGKKVRFDIDRATELFQESLTGSGDVSLSSYIDAYRQLNSFFSILGNAFSFVEKDLLEKEKIIGELQASDLFHYSTVNSMLSWECRSGQPTEKGSRTLLRLHRALIFVADFLKSLNNSQKGDEITTVCQASYERTLSKHHSWLIRKCVGVATHLLGSRDHLMKAITNEKGPRNEKEVQFAITRLVDVTEKVCARVQQIYKEKNVLDLP